jgi:hypothetical protein
MNEGHSAFCGLERIRLLMEEHHLDFATAREAVTAGTVFTTHTPVPAGNDVFAPQLIEQYLGHLLSQFKISSQELLGLGRQNPADHAEPFCMTVLAVRLANVSNGVSALHGKVSRKMWKAIWPEVPEAEVPITHITNGVHTPSWVSPDLTQLYDRYLGPQWSERPAEADVWKRVDHIPDAELWRTHERRRERLVAFARQRLKRSLTNRGAPPSEVVRAEEALDPEALTIGFARRFATYKRGTLLFRNLDRLTALITSKDRPVQIIFSGKAHPRDHGGKELIAEILHVARRPELRRNIVFLEDYDMSVARYLVQGVDVWLNNPRRPLEASGTSGMKVACNGGLNMSILDGWWEEGYDKSNGWAIGAGEEYTDLTYQDDVESRAIYDLRPSGAGGGAAVLHADARRSAARLDQDDEAVDPDGRAAVQHRADGGRVHGALLRAVGGPLRGAGGQQPPEGRGAGQVAPGHAPRLVEHQGRGGRGDRGQPDARRQRAGSDGASQPGAAVARRRRGAAVPRSARLAGRHPRAGDGDHEPQRRRGQEGRQRVGLPRHHSVSHERPARLRGAGAAAAFRPAAPLRARPGNLGVRMGEPVFGVSPRLMTNNRPVGSGWFSFLSPTLLRP